MAANNRIRQYVVNRLKLLNEAADEAGVHELTLVLRAIDDCLPCTVPDKVCPKPEGLNPRMPTKF